MRVVQYWSHSSETGIEKCHVRFISYPSGRGQNVKPYYSKLKKVCSSKCFTMLMMYFTLPINDSILGTPWGTPWFRVLHFVLSLSKQYSNDFISAKVILVVESKKVCWPQKFLYFELTQQLVDADWGKSKPHLSLHQGARGNWILPRPFYTPRLLAIVNLWNS